MLASQTMTGSQVLESAQCNLARTTAHIHSETHTRMNASMNKHNTNPHVSPKSNRMHLIADTRVHNMARTCSRKANEVIQH